MAEPHGTRQSAGTEELAGYARERPPRRGVTNTYPKPGFGYLRAAAPLTMPGRMLRTLRIENLVLIHKAELGFAPGLNAITGETGAGKTILAQGIGLLLGAKGDAAYIGAEADEAYVEAELDLPPALLDEDDFATLAE